MRTSIVVGFNCISIAVLLIAFAVSAARIIDDDSESLSSAVRRLKDLNEMCRANITIQNEIARNYQLTDAFVQRTDESWNTLFATAAELHGAERVAFVREHLKVAAREVAGYEQQLQIAQAAASDVAITDGERGASRYGGVPWEWWRRAIRNKQLDFQMDVVDDTRTKRNKAAARKRQLEDLLQKTVEESTGRGLASKR